MDALLVENYKSTRRAFRMLSASDALKKARIAADIGKRTYETAFYPTRYKRTVDDDGMAFFEDKENPFRLVGFADEVAKRNYRYAYGIEHTGWFTDDFQTEVLRGVVYRLNHGRGFVIGYCEGETMRRGFINNADGCVLNVRRIIACDIADDENAQRDAARRADRLAEIAAENARNWNAASNARQQFESIADDIGNARKHVLKIIAEIKATRKRGERFGDAICGLLRKALAGELQDIGEWKRERAQLAADYSFHDAWKDY